MSEKSMKIVVLEKMLGFMSRSILWRYKPRIIAITGSVGKTTTKDVVVHILKKHKKIYYTKKNYNNEIGVALTVLGFNKNIDSILVVMQVIFLWIVKMIYCKYPEIVIVEMGVDRVGDMDFLTKIAPPDISILTAISYAHNEFFDDIKQIAIEKQKIVTNMKKGGVAVINIDDEHVSKIKGNIITYGINHEADFLASDINVCFSHCEDGKLTFKVRYNKKTFPVKLNNIIARHFVYAVLAGIAIADIVKIDIKDVLKDLENFKASAGRMNLVSSKYGNAFIIDDTYNASPASMKAAIRTLKEMPGSNKMAILGDMRELGNISQEEHLKLKDELENIGIIFLIGKEMCILFDDMHNENRIIKYYSNSKEAKKDISKYINNHKVDVILVKGSRGIHMEDIVNELI